MKKSLLLAVAAMMSVGAVAQNLDNNITPKNYYYNDVKEFSYANFSHGANPSAPAWAMVSEKWADGAVLIQGGQYNPGQPNVASLQAGTGLVNLGGEVGQVLAVSGQNSKINDVLKELYPELDVNVPLASGGLNWFNFNWFMDPNTTPKLPHGQKGFVNGESIRVRITLSCFGNTLGETNNIVNTCYTSDNQNNVQPGGDNTAPGVAVTSGDFCKLDADGEPEVDENENLVWDPTKWMVYEFDTYCIADDENGTQYAPLRVKMEMNGGNLANGTIFIKSVEFFHATENEGAAANVRLKSFKTLEMGGATAVNAITADKAGDGAIYDLMGRKVVNPTNGIYIQNGKKFVVK